MRKNRKKIDEFLIALEDFIETKKEELSETDIMILVMPLKHSKPGTNNPIGYIELPNLTKYVNKKQANKYLGDNRKRRTDSFVRRAAYSLDFISAYGVSYEDIFKKILIDNGSTTYKFKGIVLKNFYFNGGVEGMYIVPKDYGITGYNLYYNGDFEIIE